VECDRRWDHTTERSRIYFSCDEPTEPLPYCPDCSKLEFGD